MNIKKYLNYVKKRGFKNYYHYLRFKYLLLKYFGVEILGYDDFLDGLNKSIKAMAQLGCTAEEFANAMINSFKSQMK